MNRGDLVTVAMPGDFGKPRPALVIQSDLFQAHGTVTVLLLSSLLIDAPLLRVSIEPDEGNGLKKSSQVMIDKAMTVRRERLGPVFGFVGTTVMLDIERCLVVFLGIAK